MSKSYNPSNAPEFSDEHPDIDFMLGGKGNPYAPLLMRIFDVSALLIEEERAHIRRDASLLEERENLLRQAAQDHAQEDGCPEDICGTLNAAIKSYGARGHLEAKVALGDKLYFAIKSIAPGASWSWLCRQNERDLPKFAKMIEKQLGRPINPLSNSSVYSGDKSWPRSSTVRKAVRPDELAALLLPLSKGQGLYFPIDQLKEYRLTAGDWNALVGQTMKKVQMGFINRSGFGAYLLKAVARWEQAHPIKGG